MNLASPTQMADLFLHARQSRLEHNHGARVMRICKAIGHDPVRLAGAIRNANADRMADLCCELIRTHSPDFDGDVTALVEALSLICNDAARDEA